MPGSDWILNGFGLDSVWFSCELWPTPSRVLCMRCGLKDHEFTGFHVITNVLGKNTSKRHIYKDGSNFPFTPKNPGNPSMPSVTVIRNPYNQITITIVCVLKYPQWTFKVLQGCVSLSCNVCLHLAKLVQVCRVILFWHSPGSSSLGGTISCLVRVILLSLIWENSGVFFL